MQKFQNTNTQNTKGHNTNYQNTNVTKYKCNKIPMKQIHIELNAKLPKYNHHIVDLPLNAFIFYRNTKYAFPLVFTYMRHIGACASIL